MGPKEYLSTGALAGPAAAAAGGGGGGGGGLSLLCKCGEGDCEGGGVGST